MTAALMLTALLAGVQAQTPVPPADTKLIRVFVDTSNSGEASYLGERLATVKDLSKWLADKKKDLVIVDDEDRADVVLRVVERWVTTPSIVMGASGSRPGQSTMPSAPARICHVRVMLTHDGESVVLTSKNSPLETNNGWKAAAEDVAKQAHKWISDRRGAILAAR